MADAERWRRMPTTRFSAEPDAVVGSVLDTFYLDGVFCEDASIRGRHRAGPVGRSVECLPCRAHHQTLRRRSRNRGSRRQRRK